jgi:hypothetical protein
LKTPVFTKAITENFVSGNSDCTTQNPIQNQNKNKFLVRVFAQMGLFKFVTGFAVGVYTGLFISKNYNVPDVPGPDELIDKLKKIAEDYKKENKKPDDK